MSEGGVPEALPFPASTRTSGTWQLGLEAGLRELCALRPPAFLLECRKLPKAGGILENLVAAAGLHPLALVAPLQGQEMSQEGPPFAGDLADPKCAPDLPLAGLSLLAGLKCSKLILPVGCAALPGARGTRALLAESQNPMELASQWKESRRAAREEAAGRLARRLDALARREEGVRLLLTGNGDPLSVLDVELARWVLEDLSRRNVGLALDLGQAGLLEALGGDALGKWFEELGRWLDLVFLSDHDGRQDAKLLPGSGLLPYADLRGLLPRTVPWVLRGDPRFRTEFLRGAASFLLEALGSCPTPPYAC